MGFLTKVVFGVRLWILLYLFASFFGLVAIIIWFMRERILKAYYTIRYPEKVIKVIIHYKTGLYKVYYRLIPTNTLFKIQKTPYYYDKKVVTKEHEFFIAKQHRKEPILLIVKNLFVKKKGKKEIIKIGDTEEYEFKEFFRIKEKGRKYPEIHYLFNYPNPLKFDLDTEDLQFTSKQLREFKENDLISKLLTMKGERNLMMMLMIMVIANLIATVFIIAKMMGWIQ